MLFKRNHILLKIMVLCIAAAFMTVVAASCAQRLPSDQGSKSEKPYYQGKTITLIVPTKAGGGYDTYARLLARHMEKYLPGSTIIVKNVPGAGHIIGCNEIYNAKPDGLTFGTLNSGLITGQISGMEGIKFDLTKMSWLGSMNSEARVFVMSSGSPFKTIEDVIKSDKKVLMASAGIGTSSHTDNLMLARILGIKNFKLITGYSGNEANIAMMRGEVHGQASNLSSMKQMMESRDAIPILMINKKRVKEYPEVPNIFEYTPDKTKPLASFMVSQGLITRPYAGPPGIPPDRLAILREAFEKACGDPDLLAEAKKIDITIELIPGKEVEQLVRDALEQTPELTGLIREITKRDAS